MVSTKNPFVHSCFEPEVQNQYTLERRCLAGFDFKQYSSSADEDLERHDSEYPFLQACVNAQKKSMVRVADELRPYPFNELFKNKFGKGVYYTDVEKQIAKSVGFKGTVLDWKLFWDNRNAPETCLYYIANAQGKPIKATQQEMDEMTRACARAVTGALLDAHSCLVKKKARDRISK